MDVGQPLYIPDDLEHEVKLMGPIRVRLFAGAWKVILARRYGLPGLPASMLVPLDWSATRHP